MNHDDPTVVISARGEERIRSGHPWIYRADVGDVARRGRRRRARPQRRAAGRSGYALYSDRSQIALRMLTRGDDAGRRRADSAARIEARDRVPRVARASTRPRTGWSTAKPICCRRSSSIATATTSSCRRCRRGWIGCCRSSSRRSASCCSRAGILARNDPRARLLEGLEQTRRGARTARCPTRSTVREGGVEYDVDLRHGQKTGLFLDQRENREAAALLRARPRCSTASATTAASRWRWRPACERDDRVRHLRGRGRARAAERRAQRRRRSTRASATSSTSCAGSSGCGERFDTIVLDPPAFAKNKAAVPKALAGYKEINLRALKLLNPGGTLVTCSCSYNVNEAMFAEIVYDAARRRAGARDASSRSGCRAAIIRCCSACPRRTT